MSFQKKIFLEIFFCLFFFIFSPVLSFSQEGRIGYIDSMRLRNEYKEFADAQAKLDKEVEVWRAQADSIKKELDSLQADYDNHKLILSDAKKKEKEELLEKKKGELDKFAQDIFLPGGKIEKRNIELTKPILEKINNVLEKIAAENNYMLIFDSVNGNIAYAKKALDLTDKVLEELNKQQ